MPAQIPSSIEKVAEIDTHIGAAMSGLTPDARTLIEHARVEAQVADMACSPTAVQLSDAVLNTTSAS